MSGRAPEGVRRTLALTGGSLEYTLRRSQRARRLRIAVDGAHGVVVTIPARGAIRDMEAFLRERESWLLRHLATHARQRERLATRRGSGPDGRILFRGELHRLRLVRAEDGGRRSLVLRVGADGGDELVLLLAAGDRRTPAALLEGWMRERAAAAIDREIATYAPGLGVAPKAISIRDQKTRWGSASRTGRLCFSWRLILAPPAALETVVVHELAHLRVFGHAPAFWSLVASRKADHRTWRKWLRDHALDLHTALDGAAEPAFEEQLTLAGGVAI